MKISFLLSSFGLSGGVQVVVEYANRLSERGHQVTLVMPGGTSAAEMVARTDPRIRLIESPQRLRDTMTGWQNIRLALSLAAITPRSDLLISTHTPTTIVGFLAAHLLRKGRLLWLFQDYQEMFIGRPVESWLLRYALWWHQMALTVSTFCQQELPKRLQDRIVVVGEGLSDGAQLQPLPVAQRPTSDVVRIFYVGDARPRKGLADFLAATARVYQQKSTIKLWLAFKDATAVATIVPHEIFYRPSREQLIALYTSCDLFVSASWREGFGLPPLEAMACGTPVVMTDSGGVMEYARDGENALVVPVQRPDLLAEAILHLLNHPELAATFSENGPKTAQQYEWTRAVDRFEAALYQAMKQK